MELFTVNRYTEEDANKNDRNEEAILQKLLQKAEKRKTKQKEKQEINNEKAKNDKKLKDADEIEENAAQNFASLAAEEQLHDETMEIEEQTSEFQILGEDAEFEKKQKIDMVLPYWLAHPTIISSTIPKLVDNESLESAPDAVQNLSYLKSYTRQALKEMGITRLFPVQTTIIPWVLEANRKPFPFRPRDICVSAPTGSGKTLAFAIPVVQMLADRVVPKIRALVVLPVTELALQVYKVFKTLCDKTDLKVCLLSNKTPFALEQDKLVELYREKYYSRVDIIVTTPGRLVEHIHGTKGFCLKELRYIVIDEADRIMDAIFQNWLYHVDIHVRDTTNQLFAGRAPALCISELRVSFDLPRKMLFSATLSQDPEKLQNLHLFHPQLFTSVPLNIETFAIKTNEDGDDDTERGQFIGKYTTPAELTEKYCITETRLKPLTLFALIKENNWKKFLCFTNSAEAASRLAYVLGELFQDNLTIQELSSNLKPGVRNMTLRRFTQGSINCIICSDALARGIDVPNVDIVISYDLPRHIKTYIHRVGRTARAGNAGTAITLLTQNELTAFNKMLGDVGKVITDEIIVNASIEEEYTTAYKNALTSLRDKLERSKNNKLVEKKRNQHKANVHTKNPEELTLMEKLQLNAGEQIKIKLDETEAPKGETLLPISSNKKFNINLSKHKKILE